MNFPDLKDAKQLSRIASLLFRINYIYTVFITISLFWLFVGTSYMVSDSEEFSNFQVTMPWLFVVCGFIVYAEIYFGEKMRRLIRLQHEASWYCPVGVFVANILVGVAIFEGSVTISVGAIGVFLGVIGIMLMGGLRFARWRRPTRD